MKKLEKLIQELCPNGVPFKKVKDVYDYTPEELFLLTLTFSGKIKRDEVFDIYGEVIEELDLDLNELQKRRKILIYE